MIKLTKLLLVLLFLLFTGCEDKPVTVIVDNSDYMKKMDPRLKAYPEAVEWYEDAESYPEAAFSLGYFYKNTLKDYTKSIKWYKIAYKMGYLKSANNIASVYMTIKNYESSIEWYNIAISKNINKAYYNIALLYDTIIKDYDKAIDSYKIAIEREFVC